MFPLSYSQSRMWFVDQLAGSSPSYNIPVIVSLSGALDVDALEQAIRDVVGRHEPLRTLITPRQDGASQVVLPYHQGLLCLARAQADRAALPLLLSERARQSFDLSHEIPLRAALFSIEPAEHTLLLVVHHTAADGASLRPLLGDLSHAYAARCQGLAPEWKPLPARYVDYVTAQREKAGDGADAGVASEDTEFWKDTLAGAPAELALPADRPRLETASYQGGLVGFEISAQVHQRLVAFARNARSSVFMTMHAALAILLTRLRPAPTCRSAPASRDAPRTHSTTWSDALSTPWCCGPTPLATPPSAS